MSNNEHVSRKKAKLILASASPRRLELLKQISVTPDEVIAADIDESPLKNEKPADLAKRLSQMKAEKIADNHDAFILASDTVVACGRRILGKAFDIDEARNFLKLLSGRRHNVYTAICLITPSGEQSTKVVQTQVKFKCLNQDEIEFYLSHDEWKDKAGGYAIQGLAARFIRGINGSYSNVVGLPLFETVNLLKGRGFPL